MSGPLCGHDRINLQHHQWTELFGYLLHPQIPTTNTNLRVADVGTGTGAWLTSLGANLPSTAQLDGLDVSLQATPPAEWLPGNIRFRRWDIRETVPEDLVEAYDVVHIRLLSFVLHNEEIPHILQNVTKLIKPGGYLQWAEADVASFRIEKTNPNNSTEALTRLLSLSQGQDTRLNPKWVPQLAELFSSSGGLCNVQADVRDAPNHLALAMHECNLLVHELLARTTKIESYAKELEDLMPRVAAETREGACWAFTRWTVVGMKPLVP